MTATEIRRSLPVEAPEMTQLERAVLKAGCPILDEDDVARYKKAKLDERMAEVNAEKAKRVEALRERHEFGHNCQFPAGWLFAALVALFANVYILAAGGERHPVLQFVLYVATFVVFIVLGACFFAEASRWRASWKPWNREEAERQIASQFGAPPGWVTVSLRSFQGTGLVPREAEAHASHIAFQCPGTSFEVEYFYRDPFLAVLHKGRRFYIAVWDEHGFPC